MLGLQCASHIPDVQRGLIGKSRRDIWVFTKLVSFLQKGWSCVVLLFVGFFLQAGLYKVLVGGGVQGISFCCFLFCKKQCAQGGLADLSNVCHYLH